MQTKIWRTLTFFFWKRLVEIPDGVIPRQNMEARIKIQQVLFQIK